MRVAPWALATIVAAVLLAGCAAEQSEVVGLDPYRVRLEVLDRHEFFETTRVVDRHGQLLAEVAPLGFRTWAALGDIPAALRDAVVATEDRTFYSNTGVDSGRVARAAVQNAMAGETVSGASTITMQLVRMVAFDPEERYEQTLERKVREAHLAAEIGEQYTKDQILEAYLNVAFFGNRAYGVEAAANTYFGRTMRDTTVAQATLLAGLLQAPSRLDPFRNLEGARDRQRVVLDSMVAVGALSTEEADAAHAAPLELLDAPRLAPRRAHHFVDHVLGVLPDLIGPGPAARGGYTVTTTLDLGFNLQLGAIAGSHITRLRSSHDVGDAAVVAVRPRSGEIVGMVGGVNYDDPNSGQVNVATRARQVGSAFKPLAYAAALEQGWSPSSVVWDIPLSFPIGNGEAYQPRNYDGRYRGPVRLRQALANSLNAASIALLAEVGVVPAHDLASALGLTLDPDPWRYGLSLTLGGAEVTLLELTGAYAALAAGGAFTAPTAVLRVERISDGETLYEHEPRPLQVLGADSAYLITDMLSDVEARKPVFAADGPLTTSQPTAVKTGTTDDFRDNLTVGYTPYLALGVWAGNKDGRPMRNALGITGAAPIWHDGMEAVFANDPLRLVLGDGRMPDRDFVAPEGIVRASVCELGSMLRGGRCQPQVEVFAADAPATDVGTVYDWLVVQDRWSATDGRSTRCAVPSVRGQGRLHLMAPNEPGIADQVRRWAAASGVPIAPPWCSGEPRETERRTAALGRDETHRTSAAPSLGLSPLGAAP